MKPGARGCRRGLCAFVQVDSSRRIRKVVVSIQNLPDFCGNISKITASNQSRTVLY
nr:MAG TPA: hypothetical protein [Caudoviricetes sp.]